MFCLERLDERAMDDGRWTMDDERWMMDGWWPVAAKCIIDISSTFFFFFDRYH